MDRYGNRRYDASNTTTLGSCTEAVCNPTISTSTNRFTSSGWQYDAAGNVTGDAEGKDFIYDAENHQIEVKNDQAATIGEYRYDGDGRRVKKIAGEETTVFVYNASGQLVAEYSTQTSSTPQTSYLTTDHLGSTRLVTDQLGVVKDRKDYGAFGDEIVTSARVSAIGYTSGGDEVRKGYTGYEKDGESGLEFAQARYYSSTHGRYTSVDPLTASASIRNPQTFNRYSYVLNSPYKYVDPLGLISSSTGACGQWCQGNDGGANPWTQSSDSGWRNGWELAAIPVAMATDAHQAANSTPPQQVNAGIQGDTGETNLLAPPLARTRELFMELWGAYPTFSLGKHDLFLNSNGLPDPANQCAIRFSYAMLQVFATADRYRGRFSESKAPQKEGYVIRAEDMADWTSLTFARPVMLSGPNIAEQLQDRIGIVFLRDFPAADPGNNNRYDHIDLWNGFAGRFGSTSDPTYINGPKNWFDNAREVLFWEFK